MKSRIKTTFLSLLSAFPIGDATATATATVTAHEDSLSSHRHYRNGDHRYHPHPKQQHRISNTESTLLLNTRPKYKHHRSLQNNKDEDKNINKEDDKDKDNNTNKEAIPSSYPTFVPTFSPSSAPTVVSTYVPTLSPTYEPTRFPTSHQTSVPTFTMLSLDPTIATESPTIPVLNLLSGPSIAPSFGATEQPTDDEKDIKRPTYASMEPSRTYSSHPSGTENREVGSGDSKFNSEYRPSASPSFVATEEPTVDWTNIKRPTAANTQPTVENFVSARFSLLFENDEASFALDEDPEFQSVVIDAVSQVLCERIDLFEIVEEEESQDVNLCLNYIIRQNKNKHVHHKKPGPNKDEVEQSENKEEQNENEDEQNDDGRYLARVMLGGNDRGPTAKFIESNGIEFRSVNVDYEVIKFRKDEDILSLRELVDTAINESVDNGTLEAYLVSNDKRILEISRVGEEMQAFESYFPVNSADDVDEVASTEGTYTQLEPKTIQPIRIAGIFLLMFTCGGVFMLLRTAKKRSIEREREVRHLQQMAVLANEESVNKFLGAPVAR